MGLSVRGVQPKKRTATENYIKKREFGDSEVSRVSQSVLMPMAGKLTNTGRSKSS